jgi:DNA-binding transcriptional ArsR family regulator
MRAFGGTLPAGEGFDKSTSMHRNFHGITLQSLVAWRLQMSLDRVIAGTQVVVPVRRANRAGAEQALALTLDGRAESLATLFKALGHEGRLSILCHLADGERSVTALETLLGQRQAAVSQQLARLRLEGVVSTRRDGKTIFYAIQDQRVIDLLRLMPGLGA